MRTYISTLLALILLHSFHVEIKAQSSFSGNITDSDTQQPISGASVYILNTLKGTVSDKAGNFYLNNVKDSEVELLISHISYLTQSFKLNLKQTKTIQVTLTKNLIELDEVQISDSRDKQWKRNLKKFKKAFFGNTANASSCKILNPWVLDFHQDDNVLMAEALAPLRISNITLGYEIVFYLEHFSTKGAEVSYSGKPFFKELEPNSKSDMLRWEYNRTMAFFGSERHFFTSLKEEILATEGYVVFESKLNAADREFVTGIKLNQKDFYIDAKLKVKNFLKIIYKKEKPSSKYQFQNLQETKVAYKGPKADLNPTGTLSSPKQQSNSQVSYLFLRKDGISISDNGLLSEPKNSKVYGYWAWEGIAELLPFEYIPEKFKKSLELAEQNIPRKNGFLLRDLKIDIDEIKSGGPPKDGIPALDYPVFIDANNTNYMNAQHKVIGVNYNGTQKAYPISILNYHEIVNDSIGELSFVVTYCPLCGSGIVFNSEVNGSVLTFGVSGLLYNSDVLLYDDQSESLWSQIEMQSIAGEYANTPLEIMASELTSWSSWKTRYPHTKVLSKKTGHIRNYDKSPYVGYDTTEKLMFEVSKVNDAFKNKEVIIGVERNGKYKAYPMSELAKTKGEIIDLFEGKWYKIYYDDESKTAVVKSETGVLLPSVTMYWFAWYAFHPDTDIYVKR